MHIYRTYLTTLIGATMLLGCLGIAEAASFQKHSKLVRPSVKSGFKRSDPYYEHLKRDIRKKYFYTDHRGMNKPLQARKVERVPSRTDPYTGKISYSRRTTNVPAASRDGRWNDCFPQDSSFNKAFKEVQQEAAAHNWHQRRINKTGSGGY